jgi:hypothetical protein
MIPRRSLQAVKSWVRGIVYMRRQAPWAIPHEAAKTADVVVLTPQIAIFERIPGVFVLVTEKAFDTITIQSKVIPFER